MSNATTYCHFVVVCKREKMTMNVVHCRFVVVLQEQKNDDEQRNSSSLFYYGLIGMKK